MSLLLTGIQETQEQASSSSNKETLSTVTNRFELQEVRLECYIVACLKLRYLSVPLISSYGVPPICQTGRSHAS